MDIQEKAQWHLETNGGFIPVLENTDGQLVHESEVIMNFASQAASQGEGLPLWPHEIESDHLNDQERVSAALKTAQMKLDMLQFDKLMADFWIAYRARYLDPELNQHFRHSLKEKYEPFFKRLT
mmetsp:Transcript_17627/g.29773  ORF Transcript_17627/g.29773 Transcript_17627/m.29773 type:complete len:124 (-) Transcript_17627:447-818(-)|eukprot:CAMPEP_0168614498 /NCGR_PEP_ID=MMETSP0449_2-20121227/4006_1 /TAXON_ID=1082188 /ORGANISM="Strombidium rassoulzadegani, Strain ras09" /LENGTH=123 /DNA_ID=CAMNT_0008655181 /DNA_START=181 /DNA_END=552 /DNA_ORIENTATION=-